MQVDCIPDDGFDTGAAITTAAVQIGNTPPQAPSIDISPSAPSTSDALTASVTTPSFDADNDSISYDYLWKRDGQLVPQASGSTVPAFVTSKGDTWEVFVTPDDGSATGPAATASVIIENTLPTISDCRIQPTQAATGDDLLAKGLGWDDLDGDTETIGYEWFELDSTGTWVSIGTGETLPNAATTRDQEIKVTCTPYNGAGSNIQEGPSLDALPITIENTSPALSKLRHIPTRSRDKR